MIENKAHPNEPVVQNPSQMTIYQHLLQSSSNTVITLADVEPSISTMNLIQLDNAMANFESGTSNDDQVVNKSEKGNKRKRKPELDKDGSPIVPKIKTPRRKTRVNKKQSDLNQSNEELNTSTSDSATTPNSSSHKRNKRACLPENSKTGKGILIEYDAGYVSPNEFSNDKIISESLNG